MTPSTHSVVLLTRSGCSLCDRAERELATICRDFGIVPRSVDIDEIASTQPELRAEYGDRVPVVLLDDREHSYWEVDEPRLRNDLAG